MRFLKYCLSVFFLFVLFQKMVNPAYAAEPTRTVRVGIYYNSPKIYIDADDKVAGVFADILNYIAEKENWKLEYVMCLWDEGLTRLDKGEIDVMVDVAISEDREKRFDFTTETVMNSWAEIYVQKDSSIDSILNLTDKKISILKSSIYMEGLEGVENYLKAFGISATIVEVETYRETLGLLEMGKVDAAVISHIYGLANQKKYPNLKATKIFLKPTELRFALTKGDSDNPYLIERLDYWVGKLKNGHEDYYHQSLERHGLLELEPQAESQTQQKNEVIPYWVLPAALGVAFTLLLACLMLAIIFGQTKRKATKLLKDKKTSSVSSNKKSPRGRKQILKKKQSS